MHIAVGGEGDNMIRYAALAGQGVYRNTDDFFFWAVKNSGLPSGLLGRVDVRGLATSRRDPRVAYLALDNGNRGGGLYRTVNGGAAWQLLDWRLVGRAQIVAVSYADDEIVYGVVEDRLFRSENGGGSWTVVGSLPFTDPFARLVTALLIDPSDSDHLLLGSEHAGLYASRDGGKEWREVAEELRSLKVTTLVLSDVDALYVGTERGVYLLTWSGEQWLIAPRRAVVGRSNRIFALAQDPSNPALLYAGVDGGVYRSADAGLRWEPVGRGLGGAAVFALAFDPMIAGVLYAGTADGIWRCSVPELEAYASPSPSNSPLPPTATDLPTGAVSLTITATPPPTVIPFAATLPSTAATTATATGTATIESTETATREATPTETRATIVAATSAATGSATPTWTPSRTLAPTSTPIPPTYAPNPPTSAPIPPTNTPVPPTNTSAPPTNTPVPPTNTPIPPTNTPVPPTNTSAPPTNTPVPPTNTPAPPTNTAVPTLPPRS